MPRTMFINPFKRHDVSEFPGVLVRLDENIHHASTFSAVPNETDKAKTEDDQPTRLPSDGGIGIINHGMIRETLKQEIIADVAAADQDTPYDRKAKVINKALQDMGMGKYQWELFALCGGDWMAVGPTQIQKMR